VSVDSLKSDDRELSFLLCLLQCLRDRKNLVLALCDHDSRGLLAAEVQLFRREKRISLDSNQYP